MQNKYILFVFQVVCGVISVMENIKGLWDNDKRRVSSGSSTKINNNFNNLKINSDNKSIFDDSLTYVNIFIWFKNI